MRFYSSVDIAILGRSHFSGTLEGDYGDDPGDENSKDDLELPLIDFSTLRKATNNFSVNNKRTRWFWTRL